MRRIRVSVSSTNGNGAQVFRSVGAAKKAVEKRKAAGRKSAKIKVKITN